MKYFILFIFLLVSVPCFIKAQNVTPFRYWSFDSEDSELDATASHRINTRAYACKFSTVEGQVNSGVDLEGRNCIVVTGAMSRNVKDEFSIEFFFRGAQFTFLTFPDQVLMLRFNYSGILFRTTTVLDNGENERDDFVVELNGAGRSSYNYYVDDSWHHFVFAASLKTGKKAIWVDGECVEGFSKSLLPGKTFVFSGSDGFRDTDKLDELAFYTEILSPTLIEQHVEEGRSGKHYSFQVNGSLVKRLPVSRQKEEELDYLEFAPGYPEYTVQAIDQLKMFPSPRYNRSVPVKRNMSWMDINYLHRELPGKGGRGFGRASAEKAVEFSEEMAENWNYYVDIPLLRRDSAISNREYNDQKTVAGALIDFANRNPELPTSTISIQAQIRPVHAGFESKAAYASSQALLPQYYMRDPKGQPIVQNGRKWLSPLAPLDIIQKDGRTTKFYLAQLLKHLKIPPALINENGELFGHFRKEALLKQDPAVWQHYKRSGMTPSQYSGWFQYRMDSTYRAEVMKALYPSHTHFSFYNVSAFNPEYWPDYKMRRLLNRWGGDTVYSTPDFYPRTPDNWRSARGASNGYGSIARGRVQEIALGDKFFSPFVAAGWGKEEQNIRPAQWLALLKSMIMLGADFFYTGYFNVTGTGGKWPDGFGPNDPRGYAYQIAMPAYAQAVRTWVPEFFEEGVLMNPADPKDLVRQFRFRGRGENELILVRKLGSKYLIYGSIQPNSNVKGNVPQQKTTTIELEGKQVSFVIRRQGSMYVLDLSAQQPVFYQIDGWHQYEHPYYWSDDFEIESETLIRDVDLYTIYQSSAGHSKFDFSEFTSFARLIGKCSASIDGSWDNQREHVKSIGIKAKVSKPSTTKVWINGRRAEMIIDLPGDWSWYIVDIDKATPAANLSIEVSGGYFDVDKFVFYGRR